MPARPVPPDPDRVLAVGDAHGDLNYLAVAARVAAAHGCPVIVQTGDFGALWPRSDWFLPAVDEILAAAGIDVVVFVDGNHEGFDTDVTFPAAEGGTGTGGLVAAETAAARDEAGFVVLSDRVRWAPRGHRWSWAGRRFAALGGAFSIDWRRRTNGYNWFRDAEIVSNGQLERLGTGPVDVLVTHDCPAGLDLASRFGASGLSERDERDAENVRDALAAAVAAVRPELVLHGHWHARHSAVLPDVTAHTGGPVRVEGLGANVSMQWSAAAFAVVDLASLAVTAPAGLDG